MFFYIQIAILHDFGDNPDMRIRNWGFNKVRFDVLVKLWITVIIRNYILIGL